MIGRQWKIANDHPRAVEVAQKFSLSLKIASILLKRGIDRDDDIASFFSSDLKNLQDPFAFSQMKKAVDRVQVAILKKQNIVVYGDYDVDGLTGTSIVYPALRKLEANVKAFIPDRVQDGYGLNLESLKRLVSEGMNLLITVDNGITACEQIDYLNSVGVDTIILDHHMPKSGIPNAYAIVSSMIEEGPDKNLAACGVAFKFVWAMTGSLEKACEYLDLVTIGTLADVAPVLGDNRLILKAGLKALATSKRPGIRALFRSSRVNPAFVSYKDIAFMLAPRINAAGRMGSPLNALNLLTTEDAQLAARLAILLEEANTARQKTEADAYKQAVLMIEEKKLNREDVGVLIVWSKEWHEGVIGIVAARLVERYKKPAVVLSIRDSKAKGSGRSSAFDSVYAPISKVQDMLIAFGGHKQACGLTIDESLLELFNQRVNEAAKTMSDMDSGSDLEIDAELHFDELDMKFLMDLNRLAPFGPGNPKPLFVSRNLKLKSEPKKRGKDTLCLWLTDEKSKTTCEAVGFRMFERWEKRKADKPTQFVYQPCLVNFQGITSISLELEDWQ